MNQEYKRRGNFWKDWGAVVILAVFFIGSWGGQFVTQLQVQQHEAQQHSQTFNMEDFWPQFWASTFENWQSEWLQLTFQALLISGFAAYIFRKQDEEHFHTQRMIEELRQEVKKRK